jgi:hypothetical protein
MRSNVEKERKCVILGLWAESHKKGSKNHSFSLILKQKSSFWGGCVIQSQQCHKVLKGLVTKNSSKSDSFHCFSETDLGFLSNILPQISINVSFSEMKSQRHSFPPHFVIYTYVQHGFI